MRRKLFWRMVISSILRRRSRVLVAMLAVAIGATTLSGLATITIDVPRQMAREMRASGANMVLLPTGTNTSFSPTVIDEVTADIPRDQLIGVLGIDYEAVIINEMPYVAAGTDLNAAKATNPYWYVDGEWPSDAGQVLLGRDIAATIDAKAGDQVTLAVLADQSQGAASSRSSAQPSTPDDHGGSSDHSDHGSSDHSDHGSSDHSDHGSSDHSDHGSADSGQPNPEQENTGPAKNDDGKVISDQPVGNAAPNAGTQVTLTVSGILETGSSEDGFVYLWTKDMTSLTGTNPVVTVAELSVSAESNQLQELADQINAGHPEIHAQPVARLAHSDANILNMLRSLMVIITVIVLALIMIGVSTTMMAVVTERRTEIGLRKALGADNRSIVTEFLGEAVVLGMVGGIGGAGAGYGLAQLISLNVFHRTVMLHVEILLVTVAASVIVSTLASFIPVHRAVEVDPALVLRGE